METVSREQVGSGELALPPRVQEALGQLVGSAREGLLALSVGVGTDGALGAPDQAADLALGEASTEQVGGALLLGRHDVRSRRTPGGLDKVAFTDDDSSLLVCPAGIT